MCVFSGYRPVLWSEVPRCESHWPEAGHKGEDSGGGQPLCAGGHQVSLGMVQVKLGALVTWLDLLGHTLWRRDLVVDTWLWGQEVPGSSPGCAGSTLSP